MIYLPWSAVFVLVSNHMMFVKETAHQKGSKLTQKSKLNSKDHNFLHELYHMYEGFRHNLGKISKKIIFWSLLPTFEVARTLEKFAQACNQTEKLS